MKIKIDKHIPVPPSGKGKKSIEREALELMELGDSFAYDRNDTEDLTNDRVVQAISAIKKVNKRNGNLDNNENKNASDAKKNLSEELDKLSNLLKDGVLTQEEFEKAKKKILDN